MLGATMPGVSEDVLPFLLGDRRPFRQGSTFDGLGADETDAKLCELDCPLHHAACGLSVAKDAPQWEGGDDVDVV